MKSRLLWLMLLLVALQVVPLLAQEDQDEEEPLPPPRRASAAKIGGAGGFTPLWLFWDTKAFNDVLPPNVTPFDKSPMLLLGGQGYAYVMLIENLRIGGMGAGGTAKSSTVAGNVRRDVEIGIDFGGVTLDYAVPIVERLDVVPGVMLGGGSVSIATGRSQIAWKKWDDLWTELRDNKEVNDVTRKMEGGFFVVQPSVNIEYAVLRWLGVRIGASYVAMMSPSWKVDERFDLAGVPSNIKGNGWMINAGVFAGTFLF